VGAVSGPPLEKAAMSFSFSPWSAPAKKLLYTRFQRPASIALSTSLLIGPFGDIYPILLGAARFYPSATMASPRKRRFLREDDLEAKKAREEKVIEEYNQKPLDDSPDIAETTGQCRERLMMDWTE
jgi:hypothetical protein